MRDFVAGFLLCAVCGSASIAAEPDYSQMAAAELIAALALVDEPTVGLSGDAMYDGFIANEDDLHFRGGLYGAREPDIPPQMQELVRRGVSVLPDLIDHLDDERPTRFSVGKTMPLPTFGGQFFAAEYDPRVHPVAGDACQASCNDHAGEPWKWFNEPYTVTIGDLCYVLVGQIVNRRLNAVRYQPTAILIVNSPARASVLVRNVESDWGDLDAVEHRDSLLADLRQTDDIVRFGPALARLRFYYPDDYTALAGGDAVKRAAYEAKEKTAAQ